MTKDENIQEFLNKIAADVQEWNDKNQADGGVCDFCAHLLDMKTVTTFITDKDMEKVLAGLDTVTLEAASVGMVWDRFWAACPGCAEQVKKGDPEALADYAMSHRDEERVGKIPPHRIKNVRDDIAEMYRQLYRDNLRETDLSYDEMREESDA